MQKKQIQKIFTLNWKKVVAIPVVFVASVTIHNLGSAILGVEEALFFLIAVLVLPAYTIVAFLYNIFRFISKPKS